MADSQWGKCKDCKWFQIEPGAKAKYNTMGLCIEEKLQEARLRVSGNSGCIYFIEGAAAHAEGSSEAPPVVEASR